MAEEVRRVLTGKLEASREALAAVEAVLDRFNIVPRGDGRSPIPVRDADDERVLADAVAAGAEILVTGDQDQLIVAEVSPIRILSPRAFMALARGAGP